MGMEFAIFCQVIVFLAISFGTIMAATAPRQPQAVRRSPYGGSNYVPKRGM